MGPRDSSAFSLATWTTTLSSLRQHVLGDGGVCDPNLMSCSSIPNHDGCCSPTYGIVVLAQQWYPALGPNSSFTLHGLWPDKCNGRQGPRNGCDASRHYPNLGDIISREDAALRKEMETYWPSYRPGDPASFWNHEWTKHGTCVSTLHPKCSAGEGGEEEEEGHADVLEYFHTALSLRRTYDLAAALAAQGITPGQSRYRIEDVESAIEEAYGLEVEAHCDRGRIREIWGWFRVRGRNTYVPTQPIRNGRRSCRGWVRLPDKTGALTDEESYDPFFLETDDDDNEEEEEDSDPFFLPLSLSKDA
ncbi:MAG: ribonuclease T2-like protein [Piptocephalis tieghemiana]|nr:MAG: ribonuclease T2-like protein [Piptocephalis tieghemiana]